MKRERFSPSGRKNYIGYGIIAAVSIIVLVSAAFMLYDRLYGNKASAELPDGIAEVHFIDVGQGDCALIHTADINILIDSGEADEYSTVSGYMKRLGITALDYIVMSHPHTDHMGCMYRIVGRYGADGFIMPDTGEYEPDTSSYRKLMNELDGQGIPVLYAEAGSFIPLDDNSRLEILSPVSEYEDINNYSVTLRFVCGSTAFLFTGDIEREAEQDILDSGREISADVIKVPHHGSGTSGLKIFIQAVSPRYAVFSVGAGNEHGHPHANIVSLYEKLGALIYRTDINGNIVFTTDGSTVTVRTDR